MGGLFLLIIVAPIVGMVIWIRKAKPGPGKAVAIGCGVVYLIGFVLVLLAIGSAFVFWGLKPRQLKSEEAAKHQRAIEEVPRRHQQLQIEREEATDVMSLPR